MHSTHNFDDIRPYRNDELATVLARLLDDPDFNVMLKKLQKEEVALAQMKEAIGRHACDEKRHRVTTDHT